MSTSSLYPVSAGASPNRSRWQELRLPLGITLTWATALLLCIVALAAALRLVNLSAVGDANQYYTAAIKAMLQSPSNFFFIAAEPGGSVTIDKPPLGLWIQAISAMIFGVSGVSVVLPQVIAGILSVPLLYSLVKRYFGSTAGLIAAFVLAVTPVSIAVERNNTMDATLILTLLCATWAFIRATDTGKLRYLLLGGVLIGLGFNIKMMQAFLPLPAFYALYFFGAKVGLKRKIVSLAATTVVLLAVSLSWATVVELTPVSQRPYIGSSTHNSVFELMLGYNGINRLVGGAGTPGAGAGNRPSNFTGAPAAGGSGNSGNTNGFVPGGQPPAGTDGRPAGAPPAGMMGGMGMDTGSAGVFRLVSTPLANEVGWLLPFGLISIGLVVVSTRIKFPLSTEHKGVVLWGGWLATTVVFFSIAGFFHPYYLAMLAPPLAALVGIGVMTLWRWHENNPRLTSTVVIGLFTGTLAYQLYTASQYMSSTSGLWWTVPAIIALGVGSAIVSTRQQTRRMAVIGFASLMLAITVVPTGWSAMTTLEKSPSSGLPHAYSGDKSRSQGFGPNGNAGDGQASSQNTEMIAYLQENTQGMRYMLAVPSSMQGSSIVLATGRGVLFMGGFNGSDQVVTADSLAQLVSDHQLRYVQWSGGMSGPTSSASTASNNTAISNWLKSSCTVNTQFSNTSATQSAGGFGPGGMQASTLYDCGG